MQPLGHVAAVSYLPDPLGTFLYELRHKLPGVHNPRSHITILPPRPLAVPVETAADQALATLRGFRPFTVELASIRSFPETNVLYIELADGNSEVHQLYRALNTGHLLAEEQFEFRPHLTLSGPMQKHQLPAARRYAESAWDTATLHRRFLLHEIVFLWLEPDNKDGEWTRVWSYSLSQPQEAGKLTARTY
jgi:2'-5' RNA ligase